MSRQNILNSVSDGGEGRKYRESLFLVCYFEKFSPPQRPSPKLSVNSPVRFNPWVQWHPTSLSVNRIEREKKKYWFMQSGEELLIQLTGIWREKVLHRSTELNKHRLRGQHPTWNRRREKTAFKSETLCKQAELHNRKAFWVKGRGVCVGDEKGGVVGKNLTENLKMNLKILLKCSDSINHSKKSILNPSCNTVLKG